MALRSFRVPADRLPEYAGSPLAARIRDLAVECAADLDRDRTPDRAAWQELIETAPPPRRLELPCHNPGKTVFAAMRKHHWLRKVRALAIKSDSQYGVYGERLVGVRSLFGPKALPRLAHLNLHEVGAPALLQTLGEWPGLSHLESLDLSDDYHGRLKPTLFPADRPLSCLRDLSGVIIATDEDADQFLELPGLENLASLHLSFLGHYDRTRHRYTDDVVLTEAAVDRVLRSERLARVAELMLGFGYVRRLELHVAPQLADRTVLPGLQKLRLYVSRDGSSDDRAPLNGARARFGLRLVPW
jgi:hypothetical protein